MRIGSKNISYRLKIVYRASALVQQRSVLQHSYSGAQFVLAWALSAHLWTRSILWQNLTRVLPGICRAIREKINLNEGSQNDHPLLLASTSGEQSSRGRQRGATGVGGFGYSCGPTDAIELAFNCELRNGTQTSGCASVSVWVVDFYKRICVISIVRHSIPNIFERV